jgi:thioredoxin 1
MRAIASKTVRDLIWMAACAAAVGVLLCVELRLARGDESVTPAPSPLPPVLLDFYADWCGPCQAAKPAVDSLASEGYAVRRVNIDENKELAARYGVESIPCFIMLERGREVDRVVGPASVERLRQMYRSKGSGVRGQGPEEGNPKSEIQNPKSPLVPHPAWRYERPVGHRAAVVRVYCEETEQVGNLPHVVRTRSIGSGTLVKWGGRVVVLTARHVVKDAKRIVVELHDKRTQRAKVVAVDAVWDCAVLELDAEPAGVEPVEVERGEAAMQTAGNRLESCGYGPDGRLACNSGLFLGYKRSAAAPDGPDDWFTISGHARSGDSGGGVFNEAGKLVGVLWGTDGQEVVCVQAGRLQKLLCTAIPEDAAQQKSILQRVPTPAKPAKSREEREERGEKDAGEIVALSAGAALPWRKKTEARDDAQDARIEALIELQERQARAAVPAPPKIEPPVEDGKRADAQRDHSASPALAGIVILASLAVGGVFRSFTKKKTA